MKIQMTIVAEIYEYDDSSFISAISSAAERFLEKNGKASFKVNYDASEKPQEAFPAIFQSRAAGNGSKKASKRKEAERRRCRSTGSIHEEQNPEGKPFQAVHKEPAATDAPAGVTDSAPAVAAVKRCSTPQTLVLQNAASRLQNLAQRRRHTLSQFRCESPLPLAANSGRNSPLFNRAFDKQLPAGRSTEFALPSFTRGGGLAGASERCATGVATPRAIYPPSVGARTPMSRADSPFRPIAAM